MDVYLSVATIICKVVKIPTFLLAPPILYVIVGVSAQFN